MARARKKAQRQEETLKQAFYRSNTTLLMMSVMIFQFTAMLLLTVKKDPIDLQAMAMAVLLPGGTYLAVKLFSRIWPIDRALLILTLLLCSISLVTLEDIAKSSSTPLGQAMFVLAGLVAMAVGIQFIRLLRNWDKWGIPLMILGVLALLSPLVFGQWQYGAKNWIKIPVINMSIQPSEFVKLALILVLAIGLANRPRFKQYWYFVGFAAVLCGILLIERDLGALLIYYAITLFLYYAATSNLPITLAGVAAGVVGAIVAYYFIPLVGDRVALYQNPWADPLSGGYQMVQALIAIGSGGAFGMGIGLGYPRNIPLYHSDFIFAAITEEFGLIFSIGLLILYVLILMRGTSIAMNARNSFHALVAFGVVALIGVQAFINVGGNIKLIPLTGVTLPFISSGGSSMLSMMGAMGLLLGISSINANDEADDLRRMEWREVDEE